MSKKKKKKAVKKDQATLPQAVSAATTFSVGLPPPPEQPGLDSKEQ